MTKINGYEVSSFYQGIMVYVVYKDGKEIGTCWSTQDVAMLTETDAETVQEEMWKQRYRQG